MTRTQRATSPRAIMKDHTLPKNGMDRHTPKGGAGPHNWGSLDKEWELEQAAEIDEELDAGQPAQEYGENVDADSKRQARQARHGALEKGANLGDIARTSAGAATTADNRYIPDVHDADTSIKDTDLI